jgi:hypothetical protein
MKEMFCNATSFNQDLSKWDVSNIVHKLDLFLNNNNNNNFRASISLLDYL